jgi:hypothetical protein
MQAARPGLVRAQGDLLAAHPASANLGAIGPDLFFFAPDYRPMEILYPFLDAYRKVQDVVARLSAPLRELGDELEETVTDTLDKLEAIPGIGSHVADIRILVAQIRELYLLLEAAIDSVLAAGVVRLLGLDAHDPAYGNLPRSLYQQLFQPPLQAGWEEPDWYWFDMLHYRRSGKFAHNLLQHAGNSESARAYALAYLSHIATDVVGHPYVNLICGAPYRMAVQRHVTAENYIDQWVWTHHYPDENIREHLFFRLGLAAYPDLPDDLAAMIFQAMRSTYGDICHPLRRKNRDGFLAIDDIKATYSGLRKALQLVGQNVDVRPQAPYIGADEDLAQINASLGIFDPPPPLGPPPLPNCGWEDIFGTASGACFEAFVNDTLIWAGMVREMIDWCFESGRKALNLLEDSVAYPQPGMPARWLQLLSYAGHLYVYTAYRAFTTLLAQAGLAYPEPDETSLQIPLARSLITPDLCWRASPLRTYPRMRAGGSSHLLCPRCGRDGDLANELAALGIESCCELPTTPHAAYAQEANITPDWFIRAAPFNATAVQRFAEARTPEDTRQLCNAGLEIGNAIDFSGWLIGAAVVNQRARLPEAVVFCNWNLDGDRGYGYKDWAGLVPICDELVMGISAADYGNSFAQQFPLVWKDASGRFEAPRSGDLYVEGKTLDNCILTSLNVAEAAIPNHFERLDANLQTSDWEEIVPARLRLDGNSYFENIRYINGIMTNAPSAVQELHQVLHRLEDEILPRLQVAAAPAGRLMHNHSSSHFPLDVWECIPDKLFAYRLWLHRNVGANAMPTMSGLPTTTATVALLHHAMGVARPLFLIGYSQGTLINGAAVMAFRQLGQEQADYLLQHVKLLHLACIHTVPVQEHLQDIVYAYRAYTNSAAGDPFTLTLADPIEDLAPEDVMFLANPLSWILQHDRASEIAENSLNQYVQGVNNLLSNLTMQNVAAVGAPHSLKVYLDIFQEDVLANQDAREFLLA